MRSQKVILLRIIGLLCILSALVLIWKNLAEERRATIASAAVVKALNKEVSNQPLASEDGEMPVETVDEVEYIGTLEIPNASLRLPVAATYRFEQLEATPTRYTGSYVTNDLVICAHNHPSHFAALTSIALGEEVVLQTVTGQVYRYRITNRQTIEPTAVDQVFKETSSDTDWDLSIFTCTPAGLARVLVRCQLIEKR